MNLVAAGFALTALSYGLARFAFGLLLPQIREDLALGVTAAGWIGGCGFAAYCVGIVLAFYGIGASGIRVITLAASATATVGMCLVAFAASGWTLGLGFGLAGLSTGLTSPPLAAAVATLFDHDDSRKANATINAGTAAGIVFSGLATLVAAGMWRELYGMFALLGATVTAWLWYAVPTSHNVSNTNRPSLAILKRPGIFKLCTSAFLTGLASTALWTFGADILLTEYRFTPSRLAWLWVIVGAAGISGSLTGLLSDRFGIGRVHGGSLLAIAVATLGLASASISPVYGFAAMGLFGAAYIVSTGAFLIQGIELLADRPDLGLGIPFLTLALGQAAGAPLFGAALDVVGTVTALVMFAAAAGLAIFIRPQAEQGACVAGRA